MYLKYLSYVIRHKWFVFLECYKNGCIWRGIWHDISKFYPDEFIPYARYFYGDYSGYANLPIKQEVDKTFDLAWLKHQHRNPHHYQHWVLREDDGDTKILDMSNNYILEMISDWKGAGRAITGRTDPEECRSWYLKNYNKIKLSSWTRTRVNAIFDMNYTERKIGLDNN